MGKRLKVKCKSSCEYDTLTRSGLSRRLAGIVRERLAESEDGEEVPRKVQAFLWIRHSDDARSFKLSVRQRPSALVGEGGW